MNQKIQRKYQKIDDSFLDDSYLGIGESRMPKDKNASLEKYKQIQFQRNMKKFQKSIIFKILLFAFVFYVILSVPIQMSTNSNSADSTFYIITIIAIFFFTLDIFSLTIAKTYYLWSFIFFVDLFCLLSLFLDIGWIYNLFFISSQYNDWDNKSFSGQHQDIVLQAASFQVIMKYIRLFRITYLHKFDFVLQSLKNKYNNIKDKKDQRTFNRYVQFDDYNDKSMDVEFDYANQKRDLKNNTIKYINPKLQDFNINKYRQIFEPKQYVDDDDENKQLQNSGEELSKNNMKRIMIICLIQVAMIPLFDSQTYVDFKITAQDSALSQLGDMVRLDGVGGRFEDFWNQYTTSFNDISKFKLLQMSIYQYKGSENDNIVIKRFGLDQEEKQVVDSYRFYEYRTYIYPQSISNLELDQYYVTAIYDTKQISRDDAWFNFLKIFIAIVILFFIAFFIDRDANKLIINPMREMMDQIRSIQANPVEASKKADEKKMKLEVIMKMNAWRRIQEQEKEKYETSLLIKTLIKSGKLLALGFGEAGTEIIIKNLEQEKLNPLIKGKKVICIFGFCDIKFFSELTEILKNDVMRFVNSIAEIVHSEIDKYGGSSNKNLGDAFLLVWKFRQEDLEEIIEYDDDGTEKIDIHLKQFTSDNNPISSRCELAVYSYLQIQLNIARSLRVKRYNHSKKLKRSIENFKVKMNFGLHIGWAIEGAIGSNHKIDASYLSPNVNLASRLEAASKQYGIPMLISGQIHSKLSPDVQQQFRKVDIVNLKGSKLAMHLYTYDLNLEDLPRKLNFLDEIEKKKLNPKITKRIFLEKRKKIKLFLDNAFTNKLSTKKLLILDDDLRACRKKYKKEFYDMWDKAMKFYIDGRWRDAKAFFEKTRDYLPKKNELDEGDGPSINILNYMSKFDYRAPQNWKGVRGLTSKQLNFLIMLFKIILIFLSIFYKVFQFDIEELDYSQLSRSLKDQFDNFELEKFGQIWASLGKIYLLGLSGQDTNFGKAYIYFNISAHYGNAEGIYFKFFMNKKYLSPFSRSRYKYFKKPLKKLKKKEQDFKIEEEEIQIDQELLDEIRQKHPDLTQQIDNIQNLIGKSIKMKIVKLDNLIEDRNKQAVKQKVQFNKKKIQKENKN